MPTITFEAPESVIKETRDEEFEFSPAQFNEAMNYAIWDYGFSAFTDAGNSAPRAAAIDAIGKRKDKETATAYDKRIKAWISEEANLPAILAKTRELVEKRRDNAYNGIWTTRQKGQGRVERIREGIILASAKQVLSAADWETFEAYDEDTQAEKIAKWYEGNKAKFDEATDAKIAKLDALKAERAAEAARIKESVQMTL